MTIRKTKKRHYGIKPSYKILVSADKTRNLYKIEKDQYEKLLKENIY